jgi:hypothetical protein
MVQEAIRPEMLEIVLIQPFSKSRLQMRAIFCDRRSTLMVSISSSA